jgi:hypothetical protein
MAGWSPELIEQIRTAISEYAFVPIEQSLYFKHLDNRFGAIEVSDILAGRPLMIDRQTNRETLYADADALIEDGWALD